MFFMGCRAVKKLLLLSVTSMRLSMWTLILTVVVVAAVVEVVVG